MNQQIQRETLEQILQAEVIEALSFSELITLFKEEAAITDCLPDGVCQTDPRNGDRVLFNSSRARRPHDNRPIPANDVARSQPCVVCQGQTTGVVDVAPLSQGFTFINKNLFPSLYPLKLDQTNLLPKHANRKPGSAQMPYGLHFLQWTSSLHDKDWHNMPLPDRVVVMQRLAALGKKLLIDSRDLLPSPGLGEDETDAQGHILVVKNYGRLVGGSLVHGHQQIALSNVIPRRFYDNWRFEEEHGEKFSTYLMRETPPKLLIRDYGPAVLLVPYFMRRPYDMMLVLKDSDKQHLFQLTEAEIIAVAEGWHDALRAIRWIMPQIGKETAYNVVTHNGPGAGLYFEFLPYTQEMGGFEHLGLLVCQGNPQSVAAHISAYLQR